jgi:hypothetical protein
MQNPTHFPRADRFFWLTSPKHFVHITPFLVCLCAFFVQSASAQKLSTMRAPTNTFIQDRLDKSDEAGMIYFKNSAKESFSACTRPRPALARRTQCNWSSPRPTSRVLPTTSTTNTTKG